MHGRYPRDVVASLATRGAALPVQPGDMNVVSAPLDVLGVNYYFDTCVSAEAGEVRSGPSTGMGWPVTPSGLTALLARVGRDYPGVPLVVTENGALYDDRPDDRGFVDDLERTAFLRAHIGAVLAARRAGVDVRGYFAWSLLDNFEWAHGYGPRFGLVRTDFSTQRRTLKRSRLWYRDLIAASRRRDGMTPG